MPKIFTLQERMRTAHTFICGQEFGICRNLSLTKILLGQATFQAMSEPKFLNGTRNKKTKFSSICKSS